MKRKGIVLAGGSGTRLWPITMGVSKQVLPVFDKPMIYYPLSVLMLAGIRDIAIITTPEDQHQFSRILQDGSQWGVNFTYLVQPSPDGLPQAYLLAKAFLDGAPSAMVLGDNLFFGQGLSEKLKAADSNDSKATVFAYHVSDPENYGVIDYDENGIVTAILEKPVEPPSSFALTGLYFLDGNAPELASRLTPSLRRELEIVDLLDVYRTEGSLSVEQLGRGFAWLDTGTHANLLDAGNFVRTLTERQGLQIGSPDEIAFHAGWIGQDQIAERADLFRKNRYGNYLKSLLC